MAPTKHGRTAPLREVALLLRLRIVAASLVIVTCTALLKFLWAGRWFGAICAALCTCTAGHLLLRVSSWSASQRADRTLLQLALLLPSLNPVFFHHLPDFDVTRSQWMPFLLIFKSLVATIGISLPPMHAFLDITFSAAVFGYMEFHKTCKLAGARPADANSAHDSSVASFVMLWVLPMYVVALLIAAAAVNSTLTPDDVVKLQDFTLRQTSANSIASKNSKTWDYISHLADPDPPLPLECLGITVFRRLGARPVLLHYHRLVLWVCRGIGRKVNLMFIVCAPIALYYTTLLALMRFQPALANTRLTPECLLLVMSCCFVLGRETTKADTVAALQAFQSQLAASHSLLMDQWPAHVVRAILSRVSRMSRSVSGTESLDQREAEQTAVDHDEHQQLQHSRLGREAQAMHEAALHPALFSHGLRDVHDGLDADGPCVMPGCISARVGLPDLLQPVQEGPDDSTQEPVDLLPGDCSQLCDAGIATCAHHLQSAGSGAKVSRASCDDSTVSAPDCAPQLSSQSFSQSFASYMMRGVHVAPGDLGWSWLRERLRHGSGVHEESKVVQQGSWPAASQPHDRDVMATNHECVTICLMDICGFSTWAGKVEPEKVLQTLDCLYTRLDDVILQEFPSLYKIETIGDAYIVAANLLVPDPDHAATAVRFAVRAKEEASKVPRPDVDDGSTLQTRIGLHSGSISSGIVGKIRRRYVVFGDAMNLASRTETTCPPGCVQLTAATYELAAAATDESIALTQRGEVQVKGREQPLLMYLAERRDSKGSTAFENEN